MPVTLCETALRCAADFRHVLRKRHRRSDVSALARTFPQTQAVHDAPYVIGIVAHGEARKDGVGETGRGPTVRIESRRSRPRAINFRNIGKLGSGETTRAPGSTPLTQRLQSLSTQGAIPSGGRSAADPEFTCNLGLREPPLQVLCG